MATWKKVIVSGSSAALSALQVDNLITGVVTGSANGTLGIQAINGTGNIVGTTNATNLVHTGSFTGSFNGAHSGSFTGSATLPILSQGTGVSAFSYNGSTTATIAVSGAAALTNNQMTKWSGSAFQNSSLNDNGSTVTGTTSIQLTGPSSNLTGSFSGSFTGALSQTLTFGTGVSGSISSYNGSAAATFAISGSATLSSNVVSKWTGTGLANTNITDTGTQVQVGSGASSGLSVAAGGISVTGNSTFNNNLTVTGDLTVNGTASFVNSDNLYVKDKFILINSGSNTLADSGIIVAYATGSGTGPSGSAIFLESAAAGTYGRWAVAYDVIGTATAVAADEYMVSAKIGQASGPGAVNPTWGSSTNGAGNMWVTTAGDIFIYS
jgi:hypothetical protein